MTKRPGKGHDATQDVSMSQLVPNERPVLRRGNSAQNDMSLWGGVVVGSSDFAPAPAKPARKPPWKWIAAGVGIVAAGVVAAVILSSGGDGPKTSASATPAPSSKPAAPADAAVAVPPPDAAVVAQVGDAGTPDAGPTIVAVTGEVDAISGVAPVIKAAKKKAVRKGTAKKPVPKKKTKRK